MHRHPSRSRGALRGLLLACLLACGQVRAAPPVAPDVTLDALTGPPPPTLYWVERDLGRPGSVMGEVSIGRRTRRGGARCVEGRLSPTGRGLAFDSRGDWGRFSTSLFALRRDDGLELVRTTLTDDRLGHTVSAFCTVTLTPTDNPTTDAAIMTDRGPIFLDRAPCQAAAKGGYRYVCDGDSCGYAPDAAPVLDLGPCASEVDRLANVLSTLSLASERERLASQRRLIAIWRSGGRLFEPDPTSAGSCRALRVKRTEDLAGELVFGDERAADTPFESARYRLLPTLRSARLGDRYGRTAGGGMYGMGGGETAVPLYFGSERVYLGGRWLFFERRICRRG